MARGFTASETIAASPETVWARLTDWDRATDWMKGVDSLAVDGVLGDGGVLVAPVKDVVAKNICVYSKCGHFFVLGCCGHLRVLDCMSVVPPRVSLKG